MKVITKRAGILLALLLLAAISARAQTQACAEPYAAPPRSTALNLGLSEITNSAVTPNSGQAIAYSVPQTAVNTTFIVQNNGGSSAAYCAKFGVQLGQAVIGKPIKCFLNPYINAFTDSDSNGDYVSRVLAAGAQDFFVCPAPITGSYFIVIGTAPANTFQVFARVSAQPITPSPNGWVTLFPTLLAISNNGQTWAGFTATATNPTSGTFVALLTARNIVPTVYPDRVIVTCSAACDFTLQMVSTSGIVCPAGSTVNLRSFAPGSSVAILSSSCSTPPVVTQGFAAVTLPAAGFVSLDLQGVVLPSRSQTGVAVQMNAALAGTIKTTWFWGEQ